MIAKYTQPTAEQRYELLKNAGESERFVKDTERKKITTLSRTQTYQLEREGIHPPRAKLSSHSVAWLLSDLLSFIYQRTPSNTMKNNSK